MKLRLPYYLFLLTAIIMVSSCTNFKTPLQREEGIFKSPHDERDYKAITLDNRLKVLLISDPETDKAAAAMDVRVGQFEDPKERMGLAHFLEHMLFLGTEKYPVAGDFGKYLSTNGGFSNAYTSQENTNYFFSVNKKHLEGALDRFAQFFIAPTFDPQFVDREINAVHSEHQKNIKHDGRRYYQVLRHTSNPEHPFHKFGTGTIQTLRGDGNLEALQEQLIRFYQAHYSANNMRLVILGKESLEELEAMARQYFHPIENKNIKAKRYPQPILRAETLPRELRIKPIQSTRTLQLLFPVPPQVENYPYKAMDVIAQVIGDEGPGSITAVLKNKGWITSLAAGEGISSRDNSFFNIRVTLTREGLKHIDEITAITFQYIDIVKQQRDLRLYFDESQKIADLNFQFREKEDPISYVSELASKFQIINENHLVASRWLFQEYKEELVNNILKQLTPENLQLVLIAPTVKTDQEETWYKTPFGLEAIARERVKKWKEFPTETALSLPKANPFIPEKVTYTPPKEGTSPYPTLIRDSEQVKVWHQQDLFFNIPKTNLRARLATAKAYRTTKEATMSKLFTLLLKDVLNEYSYPATVAGLHYTIENSVQGIELSLEGYPENIPLLFEKVIQTAKSLHIDDKKFEIYKNQIRDHRQNQRFSQAYQRAGYESYYTLAETLWHTNDYLEVIDQIDQETLRQFIPDLLSQMKIELLAYGNIDPTEALRYGALLEKYFITDAKNRIETITERTINLPPAKELKYQLPIEDINSSIHMYYQAGPQTIEQSVKLDMVRQIIQKPFYHQLRTIEQLGYLIWSGQRDANKVSGLYFLIQSNVKDPVYLQQRIEAFLSDYRGKVIELTNEQFEQLRQTLIAKRKERPKKLQDAATRTWNKITEKSYQFDHREKEIEALKKITLNDVIELYDRVLLSESSIKRVSIHAVGKNHKLSSDLPEFIKKLKTFRQNAAYYDNPAQKVSGKYYKAN